MFAWGMMSAIKKSLKKMTALYRKIVKPEAKHLQSLRACCIIPPPKFRLIQWEPSRSLATMSGLPGQVRKKAAKVGMTVCRE